MDTSHTVNLGMYNTKGTFNKTKTIERDENDYIERIRTHFHYCLLCIPPHDSCLFCISIPRLHEPHP